MQSTTLSVQTTVVPDPLGSDKGHVIPRELLLRYPVSIAQMPLTRFQVRSRVQEKTASI